MSTEAITAPEKPEKIEETKPVRIGTAMHAHIKALGAAEGRTLQWMVETALEEKWGRPEKLIPFQQD